MTLFQQQRRAQFVQQNEIRPPAAYAQRQPPHGAAEYPGGPAQHRRFIGLQAIGQPGRQGEKRLQIAARVLLVTAQLFQGCLAAVQPVMDLGVDEAPDKTAERDHQHARQRDIAVEGAELKIGMKKDARRPQHPQHHVGPEPVLHRSQTAHEAQPLAGRIQQQHQHHHPTRDPQAVAHTVLRGQVVITPVLPPGP